MSYNVHLVGSIPLGNATTVFERVSAVLGPRLLRLPDGETGDRNEWLGWLEPVFSRHPDFENTGESVFRGYISFRYALRADRSVKDLEFDNLKHAEVTIASWREFERLKKAGVIPSHCRFQVSFAHPVSVVDRYIIESQRNEIGPLYERALLDQIARIAAAVPHDQLAIQWDCASAIFRVLQTGEASRHGTDKEQKFARFSQWCAALGNAIPAGVDLLYHLCYGSASNKHSVEPLNMGDMVEMANRITKAIKRPIQLFHMPVPIDRSDDGYFAPLDRLELQPATRLSIGLVHYDDGVAGARTRLKAAEKHVRDFLIATECGFGRYKKEIIPDVLKLHADIAALN